MANSEEICKKILSLADIQVNGTRPWDIQVHDNRLYQRILTQGSLGLGESYMDGWWDCKSIDEFINRLLSAKLDKKAMEYFSVNTKANIAIKFLLHKLVNRQNILRSKEVAEQHYNLGNDFFHDMLDKEYMQYTCAYWKNAKTLQKAQIDKLNLICKKIHLNKKKSPNRDKIIEFGSGFGGFAKYSTQNYNCEVTSYNISTKQAEYAKNMTKDLPVNTILSDYRDAGSMENKYYFDKVVSIGMMEHVGPKNYDSFMELVDNCLKDRGIFILHTIGAVKTQDQSKDDIWTKKYIFPGGHLPSALQIIKSTEPYFILEDFQNIGHDYDKTLMEWYKNFEANWHKYERYGEKFHRMWRYYLLSCAGAFRSGNICLFQFVFSKGNLGKTYEGVR